jgi:hypothetical protein
VKNALVSIAVSGILIAATLKYGKPFLQRKQLPVAQQPRVTESTAQETETTAAGKPDSEQVVVLAGPLAQWMQNGKPEKNEAPEEPASAPQGQPQESVSENRRPPKVYAFDHIVRPSAAATGVVVQKTLDVGTDQNASFEIPPHTVSPQLHGRYRSFVGQAGSHASNASADVDFRLMTQQQYTDFLSGRPGDALFSVEASHNETVNFGLPASMDQTVTYYLVFRSSRGEGKKTVEANFQVDF